MAENIKQVRFEWKELFKTDLDVCFKITCIITLENGVVVEANEGLKISKSIASGIDPTQQSLMHTAELRALNSAKDILHMLN